MSARLQTTWHGRGSRGENFDVVVGPRRVLLHWYDPNPHAGFDVGEQATLAEFLGGRHQASVRDHQAPGTLDAVVATVEEMAARVARIDEVLESLPVAPELRALVKDPLTQSGWGLWHARKGGALVLRSEAASFRVEHDAVFVETTRVPIDVLVAVAAGGELYALSRSRIGVIDRNGVVSDPQILREPADDEILVVGDVYENRGRVFVHYYWAENQGEVGFLEYQRGRGFTARCDGPA